MIARFDNHTHTEYSNLRLKDSINKIEQLADRAIEIGLKGIAITEHDCLSGTVRLNKYAKKLQEKNPDFKLAIGNEIYLCDTRNKKQQYYHFILIAKNKQGYQALKELSSRAWLNSYEDRRMERVVTLYDDLAQIVKKYPNSLIATTACIGGLLGSSILEMIKFRTTNQPEAARRQYDIIICFLDYCKTLFGDDFYLEIAPACSKVQITVNQMIYKISQTLNIPIVIGSDAHYLKKEDRYIHEAFLKSKDGEREVASFYEYCYLQTNEEVITHLKESYGEKTELLFEEFSKNSMQIYDKIEFYDLFHTQQIPKVEIKNYPKKKIDLGQDYPQLNSMFESDDKMDRYWVNQCWDKMNELFENPLETKVEYMKELEEEAEVKAHIGKVLDTNIFGYPVLLQHYIDMMWDCVSTIGTGRGSACAALNHWLLGVTQLDPIKWNFPFFRYLNNDRVELPDIDIDICPSKRPIILQRIKEERAKNYLDKDLDELFKKHLGCTLVATFKTETAKSAILTACRGYRTEDYPDGINVETSQYLSSLIPVERGFTWTLKEVIYGNIEKGRKPVQPFIQEISKYEGLLDIAFGVEGMISGRSSHASGVILFENNPFEHCCFMKTPKGEVITQYDLHDAEFTGSTKFDFLVTSIQDKIVKTIQFLQDDNEIENNFTLRKAYDKYLHPDAIPIDDKETWKTIQEASSLDLFQLDSPIGRQGAKKIKPTNMVELSSTNGLIRLMTSEKGQETPMDKYVRFKKNPNQWVEEMNKYGLSQQEQDTMRMHIGETCGIGISQEQLMRSLMDKKICGFTLKEANKARKIVAKKQMQEIPKLKEIVMEKAASPQIGKYEWDAIVAPGLGYSFSDIHSLAYSYIGYQSAYLATHWNPIYWNTACLIVNSESLEDEGEEEEEIETKEKSSDYAKIARALGDTIEKGIKVSLIDINNSDYTFSPSVKTNEILFGLKGLPRINKDIIEQIKAGRPYTGIKDFMKRCKINKAAMIILIKAGAFDKLDAKWASQIADEPRIGIMAYYLSQVSELKKKLTLQNVSGLINYQVLPSNLLSQQQVFIVNKELKKQKIKGYYKCNDKFYKLCEIFEELTDEVNEDGLILQSSWDNFYIKQIQFIKDWIVENHNEALTLLNQKIFMENWEKYAKGTISSWEMDSVCFYHHDHELKNVNKVLYGITSFNNCVNKPIETYFRKTIPIFKISKIIGTVIAKNDTRHTVTLLTADSGVVNVKFNKEYYAMFKGRVSEMQEDGTKKIVEEGWFTRGTKLLVNGYRRDDEFVAKTYKSSNSHTLYKIDKVNEDGTIELVHERG